MEDKSFVNLLTEENLSKINIDSRLIDCFKRVADKLQNYFNANGYTSQRDYKKFFEEYLFKEMDSKLKIIVSNEPSKTGASGFYRHKQGVTEIHIDEIYLNDEELLDSILCHEFIHFLAMRGLDDIEYPDPEIKNGGFINEAITEMLTQQIYPNSESYQPQVDMLKFANLLTGNVNNYSLFLRGKVDCKGGASAWNNFFSSANAYQHSRRDKGFVMSQAINDSNYIDAQRYIIQANIHPHLITSFDDYKKWFSMLQQRPAPDNDFIDKLFIDMDRNLINKLGLKNENLNDIIQQKLLDYRQIPASLSMYDGKDVYEFEIAGHKVAIDKDRNLYGRAALGGYSSSWNPNTGIWELKVGNESLKLDINAIDFTKRKKELLERQQSIPKYFTSNSKEDVKSVEQVAKKEGLVKLEKFTLPSMNGKKSSMVIYVATYNDRIEILNNPTQIGELANVKSAQYIGLTSTDPKVGAIYSKPLDNIDNGIVFSKMNQKMIQSKMISLVASRLTPTLSPEQIAQLIEQYKQSDEYDVEDDLMTAKDLQAFAIRQYANAQYEKMSEEQKKSLYDEVIKLNEKFIISMKDGKVEVSLLFGDKYITAFKGQSELLVDLKGNGLYNEQFEILAKSSAVKLPNNSSVIQTNSDDNIIFPQNKEGEGKMDEVQKGNEHKNANELLNEYNQQLAELRTKYEAIAEQIEELMQQNTSNPIPNYQEKLSTLLAQRDQVSGKMASLIVPKRTLEEDIQRQKQFEHNRLISKVEKMLSIRINSSAGYEYDDRLKAPILMQKDQSELSKEEAYIKGKLKELRDSGELDLKDFNAMTLAVVNQYTAMKKNAPKPQPQATRDDSTFTQQQEQNPTSIQPSQTTSDSHEKTDEDELRRKYGYSDMSSEEKERFDSEIRSKFTSTTNKRKENDSIEKSKLEEQRRELRRKQFEERARAMGLDLNQIANIDNLFMQQEMIEQQELEDIEELEEHHGMMM